MDFQGTEKMYWILYAVIFLAGGAIVGGIVYTFAVNKMRSLADTSNDDNRRWEFANMQGMLALLIVLAFVGVVYAFIFRPPNLDEKSKESLSILLGFLGGQFVTICQFYYGSNVQSKAKDETVRLATEAAATTASAQAATAETMKVMAGTGNGTAPGDGHSTTVKVTPPPAPDSVTVGVKISDTSKDKDDPPKGGQG